MKRKLIALLCALLIGACAFAESDVPAPTPAPEAEAAVQAGGSMSANLNGAALTLDFDPDPQFSVCRDGYVQASFYAYGEGDLLYELYVTFPQDVRSGQTVSPANCILSADMISGIYLYISDASSDVCSAATQYLTGPYPENSDYALTFSTVSTEGTFASFTGTLDASLVEVDLNYLPTGAVNSFSGSFAFTMDLGNEISRPDEGRTAPEATQPPAEATEPPAQAAPVLPDEAPSYPYPLPEYPYEQRPPTPPAKLVTPANAQKI